MPDDAPNSVRMPEVKIPFTADMEAAEKALDTFEERVLEIPRKFTEAMAQVGLAFADLEERAERIAERLGGIKFPAPEERPNPAASLDEVAKGKDSLSVSEILAAVRPNQDPLKELLGQNHDVVEKLIEAIQVLEEIRDYAKSQEGA